MAGFRRLREDAQHGVPIRSRNVLLAEGEPTPRHQKHLRMLSKSATRGRNPIIFTKTPRTSRGPTPRTSRSVRSIRSDRSDRSDRSTASTNPRQSTRLLEQQFSARQGQRNAERPLNTSRFKRSETSLRSARSAHSQSYRSPRFSDLSSLASGLDSYRSMDSYMTDVSLGDIEALTAQQYQLERKIRRINSELAIKATTSPKMERFSTKHRGSPVLRRSGSGTLGVGGVVPGTAALKASPLVSGRRSQRLGGGTSHRHGSHLNPVLQNPKMYLGENIKPVPQTSRSETAKLMKSLAVQLM